MRAGSSRITLLEAGMLSAGAGALLLARWWRAALGARRTRSFVPTKGFVRPDRSRIAGAVALRLLDSSATLLRTGLCYHYLVGGRLYIGRRIGYGGRHPEHHDDLDRLRRHLKSGELIGLWHDPRDPGDAVLRKGHLGGSLRSLALGLLLLGAGGLLIQLGATSSE